MQIQCNKRKTWCMQWPCKRCWVCKLVAMSSFDEIYHHLQKLGREMIFQRHTQGTKQAPLHHVLGGICRPKHVKISTHAQTHLLHVLGVELSSHVRLDEAGAHRVDLYVPSSEFLGVGHGHADHTTLGGSVVGLYVASILVKISTHLIFDLCAWAVLLLNSRARGFTFFSFPDIKNTARSPVIWYILS